MAFYTSVRLRVRFLTEERRVGRVHHEITPTRRMGMSVARQEPLLELISDSCAFPTLPHTALLRRGKKIACLMTQREDVRVRRLYACRCQREPR